MCKNKPLGAGRGTGWRICQNISRTGLRIPIDQADGGTATKPAQTADTGAQHKVVGAGAWIRFQLGNHQANQGSAWNSLGAKAWGLLGLGWAQSGRGTALKIRLGSGPSLKAPATFWRGEPRATQRAGLCARRAKGTDPAQAAVACGRQLVSGQQGGHHGRPVVARWLVFIFSSQAELGCCPLPGTSSL